MGMPKIKLSREGRASDREKKKLHGQKLDRVLAAGEAQNPNERGVVLQVCGQRVVRSGSKGLSNVKR